MSTAPYILSADAGIRVIDNIWSDVHALFDAPGEMLEIDASQVARPDTALAQLLVEVTMRARERGKKLKVAGASQVLRDHLKLLALDVVLGE